MNIIQRKGFYYLRNSYRKENKVITKEKYLGKILPLNIEHIKEIFHNECIIDAVLVKLKTAQDKYQKEWKSYPDSIKRKVLIDLSAKFTYNSNAIEGSTITLDETEEIIKHKISPNKPLSDVQETLNHARVFLRCLNEELTLKNILKWHYDLFSNTKPDIAGKIRDYRVRVGNYVAPDWQDLNKLLKQFLLWNKKNAKLNPVILAGRMHYKFEKIHPFGDGNGRIGRLIIANILFKNKYQILVIEYKKRKSYYHALSKTEDDFLNYFIRRYLHDLAN